MNTPFNHPRSAVAGPRLPEGASARESLNHSGDAYGPRPHASHRAVFHRLGLSVSVAIALAGCEAKAVDGGAGTTVSGTVVETYRDDASGCKYLVTYYGFKPGGITPRLKPNGRPDCPQIKGADQ